MVELDDGPHRGRGECCPYHHFGESVADVAAALGRDFVPSLVDTDRRPDLKARYGVKGLPTIWFLTSAGEGITYIPGYVDAYHGPAALKAAVAAGPAPDPAALLAEADREPAARGAGA